MAMNTPPSVFCNSGAVEKDEIPVMRFNPVSTRGEEEYRLSRRNDLVTLQQGRLRDVKSTGAYKRVAQKVKPVDSSQNDGSIPGGTFTWKKEAITKEQYIMHPSDKYDQWLIPQFSNLARGSRLTSERVAALRIGSHLTSAEKELVLEMLYH